MLPCGRGDFHTALGDCPGGICSHLQHRRDSGQRQGGGRFRDPGGGQGAGHRVQRTAYQRVFPGQAADGKNARHQAGQGGRHHFYRADHETSYTLLQSCKGAVRKRGAARHGAYHRRRNRRQSVPCHTGGALRAD